MPHSSTASNTLALSQKSSETFVLGEKTIIFTNCKESDPGLSPALGFVSQSPDQCCQHTPPCLTGTSCGTRVQRLSPPSTTTRHGTFPSSNILLLCSNLRNLTQNFFTGEEIYQTTGESSEFTAQRSLW